MSAGDLGIVADKATFKRTRALVGWLPEAEGIQATLGRNPGAQDDLAPIKERLRVRREGVTKRKPFQTRDPVSRNTSLRKLLPATAERPDLRGSFAPITWKPEVIDLRMVLTSQKLVNIDDLLPVPKNASAEELFEFCLPSKASAPPQGVITEPDGKVMTISALNPNLRVAGSQVGTAMVNLAEGQPPVPMQSITYFVQIATSHLQVVVYRDRCVLRDGYHRAAALFRAGIYEIPCIFIEANSFEQFPHPPNSLTYEVLYGNQPPTIADFWDESVAADGQQLSTRKVIRLRADEFVVPR